MASIVGPLQFRQAWEAKTAKLAEQEAREGTEDEPTESAEDVAVLRLLRLGLHDIDRVRVLSGCIVEVLFGHEGSFHYVDVEVKRGGAKMPRLGLDGLDVEFRSSVIQAKIVASRPSRPNARFRAR